MKRRREKMTRVEKWKIVEKLKREDIQLTGCETLDEDGRKGGKTRKRRDGGWINKVKGAYND